MTDNQALIDQMAYNKKTIRDILELVKGTLSEQKQADIKVVEAYHLLCCIQELIDDGMMDVNL